MLRTREKIRTKEEPKLEEEGGKEGETLYIKKFISEQKYQDYSKRAGITQETHRKKFDEILRTYNISITSDEMYSAGNFEIKKELGAQIREILTKKNVEGKILTEDKSIDELRKFLYREGEKTLQDEKGRKYKENYLAYLVQKNIRKCEIRDFLKYKSLKEVTERLANSAIFRELETIRKEKEKEKIPFPYGKPKQITEEIKEKRKKEGKKDLELVNLTKRESSI